MVIRCLVGCLVAVLGACAGLQAAGAQRCSQFLWQQTPREDTGALLQGLHPPLRPQQPRTPCWPLCAALATRELSWLSGRGQTRARVPGAASRATLQAPSPASLCPSRRCQACPVHAPQLASRHGRVYPGAWPRA